MEVLIDLLSAECLESGLADKWRSTWREYFQEILWLKNAII